MKPSKKVYCSGIDDCTKKQAEIRKNHRLKSRCHRVDREGTKYVFEYYIVRK